MPKGKGTYGKQVGRPPESKKQSYQTGGRINRAIPGNLMEPTIASESDFDKPVIPTYDAGGRVQRIEGLTSDMASPQYMGGYKEGGEVPPVAEIEELSVVDKLKKFVEEKKETIGENKERRRKGRAEKKRKKADKKVIQAEKKVTKAKEIEAESKAYKKKHSKKIDTETGEIKSKKQLRKDKGKKTFKEKAKEIIPKIPTPIGPVGEIVDLGKKFGKELLEHGAFGEVAVAKEVVKGVKKKISKVKAKKETKKADSSWTKAVKSKSKGGATMNELVKRRTQIVKIHGKDSSEYKTVQNEINKRYGSSKRHE